MSKFTAVVVALIVAGLAYLAFEPTAVRDVTNWVNRQVGRTPTLPAGTPNYMPVVPGKGL
jgi:hypothetical protein